MRWAIIGCNVFVMRCSFSFASLGLLPTEGPEESIVHPVRGESRGHAQIDSPVGEEYILLSEKQHTYDMERISRYEQRTDHQGLFIHDAPDHPIPPLLP